MYNIVLCLVFIPPPGIGGLSPPPPYLPNPPQYAWGEGDHAHTHGKSVWRMAASTLYSTSPLAPREEPQCASATKRFLVQTNRFEPECCSSQQKVPALLQVGHYPPTAPVPIAPDYRTGCRQAPPESLRPKLS